MGLDCKRASAPTFTPFTMNLILLTFFRVWARQMGCHDITLLPPTEITEAPWLVRIESADACGRVLQTFESVYLPHGGSMNLVPLVDGLRVHDAPNIDVIIRNHEA